ncbi:MAG TPA: sigma 54-interacting transcriptional regulator, partial [Terriglobales bacterium]|nr:sigma 54-interacting transcriptional regulator [Terriglobales bacterium]
MDTIPTGAAPRIAVVTTDESVQLAAQEVLASAFHTTLLDSGEQVLPLLAEATVEAVILDLETAHASDDQMLQLVRQLRAHDEDLVLLGFTRSHNRTSRRQFEQAGIRQCFVAPVDFVEVQAALRIALEERSTEIENRRLRQEARERNSFCQLIGGSEPMRLVYDAVTRVAESAVNVLVRGESGTGKELVAQAIVA